MSIIDNALAATVCENLVIFSDTRLDGPAISQRFKQVLPGGLYAFGYEDGDHLDVPAMIADYHEGQADVRLFTTGNSTGKFHYVFEDGTRWEFTRGLMIFATLEEYEDTDEDRALDAELDAEQRAEQRMETVCGAYAMGGSSAAMQALNDFDDNTDYEALAYRRSRRAYSEERYYDDY